MCFSHNQAVKSALSTFWSDQDPYSQVIKGNILATIRWSRWSRAFFSHDQAIKKALSTFWSDQDTCTLVYICTRNTVPTHTCISLVSIHFDPSRRCLYKINWSDHPMNMALNKVIFDIPAACVHVFYLIPDPRLPVHLWCYQKESALVPGYNLSGHCHITCLYCFPRFSSWSMFIIIDWLAFSQNAQFNSNVAVKYFTRCSCVLLSIHCSHLLFNFRLPD